MRSEVVKGRGYTAVAIAAMLLLLAGCARPQGIKTVIVLPSPTPTAQHDPLTISNPVFHSGEVGVTYAPVTLSAVGGVPPYTWTSVGSLPAGLTLSSDGIVSGTPAQNGNFAFGVQVLDFGKNDTAGVPVNIPIVPRLTASLISPCATECEVELGCVSVCGAFGQVSGGAAPLTYTLTNGPLPAGTTLSGLSLTGTFKGLTGRLQFTVQVADAFGATASISPTFNMFPPITLSGATCKYNFFPCLVNLPYSGGTPNGSPSLKVTGWAGSSCYFGGVSTTCPAPSLSATASGGTVSITMGAVPGNQYIYPSGTFTVMLVETTPCGPGVKCSSGTASVPVQWTG